MLKKWSLSGFKAFGDTEVLDLAPLTILAGANSSGKSTILQSILLLKQTVQYGAETRPLALNGPLIRLGTFNDVLHNGDESGEISFSFSFDIEPLSATDRPLWNTSIYRSLTTNEGRISQVDGAFVWTPKVVFNEQYEETNDQLKAVLRSGKIEVSMDQKNEVERQIRQATYSLDSNFRIGNAGEDDTLDRWVDVSFDPLTEAEITYRRPDAVVGSLALNYFLPWYVSISFDGAKKAAQELAEALFTPRSAFLTRARVEGQTVPPAVVKIINAWLEAKGQPKLVTGDDPAPAAAVADRLSAIRTTGTSDRPVGLGDLLGRANITDSEFLTLRTQVESTLLEASAPKRDTQLEQPRILYTAAEYISTYLRTGVRYLGPLRDEPRPVYPLEALENPTDVGYRGEHTAAVLYLNGNTSLRFTPPPDVSGAVAPGVQSAALKAAVTMWLNYLGVATDVIASDAGVFGNQLQVRTSGIEKKHHLTNVGVGVSQVLPIVVSALIAPKTSLLIFEQPELHLHPMVQARLADFFFAMAADGKQCLIETHSEYMIERYRRRIAEDSDDILRHKLSIYFTERIDGTTRCRRVALSKYGAIEDWPKDFFEQSQLESRKILEAAAVRRSREKRK